MTIDGLAFITSDASYASTVDRLDHALSDHGIIPMLRWDHAAAAADAGLSLHPLLLIVFGDPKVGTALMQANPTTGIDLPLKLLVWEAQNGEIRVGYNEPAWIRARHGLDPVPSGPDGIAALLKTLASRAAGEARP